MLQNYHSMKRHNIALNLLPYFTSFRSQLSDQGSKNGFYSTIRPNYKLQLCCQRYCIVMHPCQKESGWRFIFRLLTRQLVSLFNVIFSTIYYILYTILYIYYTFTDIINLLTESSEMTCCWPVVVQCSKTYKTYVSWTINVLLEGLLTHPTKHGKQIPKTLPFFWF